MTRGTVWVALCAVWLACWTLTPQVHAMPADKAQELTALYDLALWVARVAVNEGAFKNRPEAALVWQTTRSNGKNTAKRTEWLARHSPRVHGTRVCVRGNCLWTPNLTREATFPAGIALGKNPLEVWDIRVAPLWRDTLAYVDWMVLGNRKSEDPCHVSPRTWGCEADRDGALREGLFPIGCRGTLDDGFAYERSCWKGAAGWVCDPRFQPAVQTDHSDLYLGIASR